MQTPDLNTLEAPPKADRRLQNHNLRIAGIAGGLIAVVVVAAGVASRSNASRDLATVSAEAATPTVNVIHPSRAPDGNGLVLPGSVQAYNSAPIYARTNGYVRRWLADIGDRVSAGQTLAILDAPEVDQQSAQAQADYQTALANAALARTTAVRWSALLKKDAVSTQESDEKLGDLAAKTAIANAAQANVKRLGALQGFTRLTAPFAGTVTSRSAQIGGLVASGTASATALFTVSDVHRMRIYVRVPQGVSAQIHPGLHATMTLPEYPGRTFDAVLTRSAGAVDVQSGSVLVELQSDNPDGALKPGAYSQVKFPIAAATGSVHVPASVLIFRDAGPSVAILGANNIVHLKPVTIGRDEGSTVEISAGLTGSERIVDTPPDAIADGDKVHVMGAVGAANAHG